MQVLVPPTLKRHISGWPETDPPTPLPVNVVQMRTSRLNFPTSSNFRRFDLILLGALQLTLIISEGMLFLYFIISEGSEHGIVGPLNAFFLHGGTIQPLDSLNTGKKGRGRGLQKTLFLLFFEDKERKALGIFFILIQLAYCSHGFTYWAHYL